MGIFKALGLGLAIILLKFLIPVVFQTGMDTLTLAFETVQTALGKAQSGIESIPQ